MLRSRVLARHAQPARRCIIFAAFVMALVLAACKETPKQPEAPPVPAATANPGLDGGRLYTMNCGRCHMTQGEGVAGMAPPLEDDDVVTAKDPGEMIRIVLFGTGGKTIGGQEYPSRMPGFSEILNDEEIAAVVNYTRTSWGHRASRITAADVQKERKQP